jgi:hypothetical protein
VNLCATGWLRLDPHSSAPRAQHHVHCRRSSRNAASGLAGGDRSLHRVDRGAMSSPHCWSSPDAPARSTCPVADFGINIPSQVVSALPSDGREPEAVRAAVVKLRLHSGPLRRGLPTKIAPCISYAHCIPGRPEARRVCPSRIKGAGERVNPYSVLSQPRVDNSPERGARMARREERAYREYVSDEQRSQPGCPARRIVKSWLGQDTS